MREGNKKRETGDDAKCLVCLWDVVQCPNVFGEMGLPEFRGSKWDPHVDGRPVQETQDGPLGNTGVGASDGPELHGEIWLEILPNATASCSTASLPLAWHGSLGYHYCACLLATIVPWPLHSILAASHQHISDTVGPTSCQNLH
jgi:hypothetical protein